MKRLLTGLVAVTLSAWTLFPILWLLFSSFKSRADLLSSPPMLIFTPTLSNYSEVFFNKDLLASLGNSILIAGASGVLALALGAPLGYLISRKKIAKAYDLFFSLLTLRMAPLAAISLPLYWILHRVGLIGGHTGLILAHGVIVLAVAVWLMRIVFDRIDPTIEDAAMVDGRSESSTLLCVTLPLSRAGILATFVVLFVLVWGDMFLGMILASFESRPLTVGVAGLITPHGTYWGQVAAIGVVSLAPAVAMPYVMSKMVSRTR